MGRYLTALVVAGLAPWALTAQNLPSAEQVAKCMSDVLSTAPSKPAVRTSISNGSGGPGLIIEYSFDDKTGVRRRVQFNVLRDPNSHFFFYDLGKATSDDGPVTREIIRDWLVKCQVGGALVTN